jgi:hypothetical protein
MEWPWLLLEFVIYVMALASECNTSALSSNIARIYPAIA